MIDNCIAFVAPHLCSGCKKEGFLLCESCKNDIIMEPYLHCVACGKGVATQEGLCGGCTMPYERAWCVADRKDHLQRLIGNFKFTNARAAFIPLANLLDEYLPELPRNTVIVPVPTISSHIRQRGYDHMLLVARQFAKQRGLQLDTSLQRALSTEQSPANRTQRITQAKSAFACSKRLDAEKIYLLVDDVITTGATVKYATQKLRDQGARKVWVVSISRQPLD